MSTLMIEATPLPACSAPQVFQVKNFHGRSTGSLTAFTVCCSSRRQDVIPNRGPFGRTPMERAIGEPSYVEKTKKELSERRCNVQDSQSLRKNCRKRRKEVFDYGAMDPTLVAASPDPDDKQVAYWKNQWPQNPPEFREACQEYAKDVVKLALKLMQLIALSLGLPAKRFEEFFVDHTSNVLLNYYPSKSNYATKYR